MHGVAAPVLAKPYGPALVTGRVVGVEAFARKPRILLDRLTLIGLSAALTPAQVRIRLRGADLPAMGSQIAVFARLSPPSGPAAPGAFDFRRHAWFARIGGYGYALGAARVQTAAPQAATMGLWITSARQNIATRVRESAPGPSGAVAAALITGDRSAIPLAVMTAMRDSGLAHLLAISGLHMGLVAAILFFGLRAIFTCCEAVTLRYPIKKWAAGAALCGALGYMVLTGATVPTQRAFLMTGLVLLAVMIDRTAISLRLVAWAAAVILLIAPQSLLGASFLMSFAAVVALIAVYEQGWRPLGGWFTGAAGRRAGFYIGGVALTTIIAGVATGLFAMYHFGRIAHFGLAANLIAVPLIALWIMPWAVVSMVLRPFELEEFGLSADALGARYRALYGASGRWLAGCGGTGSGHASGWAGRHCDGRNVAVYLAAAVALLGAVGNHCRSVERALDPGARYPGVRRRPPDGGADGGWRACFVQHAPRQAGRPRLAQPGRVTRCARSAPSRT